MTEHPAHLLLHPHCTDHLPPRSKASGRRTTTNHRHLHSVPEEPTSVPGRGATCRGGTLCQGTGPALSEQLPQTLAEASDLYPPPRHMEGVATTTLCGRYSAGVLTTSSSAAGVT